MKEEQKHNNYYNIPGNKVWDFFIGVINNFGLAIGFFALYWLCVLFVGPLSSVNFLKNSLSLLVSILIPVLLIVVEIKLIRKYLKNGRTYIAIGMIVTLIIPLLVTGFCSMLFSSINNPGVFG